METQAKDIMTRNLILGTPQMSIEEAIKLLVNNHITGMPVIDENEQLIGVVSEYDILKSVEDRRSNKPLNLGGAIHYTQKVTTIREDTAFEEILRLFLEKKVRRLPVLNQNSRLVGIITRRDIMRILFYRSKL